MNRSHPLDPLFFPNNITIIGASKNPNFGSGFFISALTRSEYPREKLYLVNPKYAEEQIKGLDVYSSINEIKDDLDLVISAIRAKYVPKLLRECVKLNVKFVLVFTSGFSELLNEDSIKLEKELLGIIKGSSTRIIGPNCLGPLCPEAKVTYNPIAVMRPGNIAFCSQSGGHASNLVQIQSTRVLYFSRGLSFGNQIDVNCLDVLKYYAQDSSTDVIGMYLESTGSARGEDFFKELKKVTKSKPVVIWKGGQTESGSRAAASHTGAISSSLKMWETAIHQAGGMFVLTSTEFWDLLHMFSCLIPNKRLPKGDRVALLVPGGGNSVEMTDTFSNIGFKVPELGKESQEKIAKIYPGVNTSFRNPIDTGASGIFPDLAIKTIKILEEDPAIDIIVNFLPINWITNIEHQGLKNFCKSTARSFGRLNKNLTKPLIFINPLLSLSDSDATAALGFRDILFTKNIPHFNTIKDTAIALRHLREYQKKLITNK